MQSLILKCELRKRKFCKSSAHQKENDFHFDFFCGKEVCHGSRTFPKLFPCQEELEDKVLDDYHGEMRINKFKESLKTCKEIYSFFIQVE